MGTMECYRHDPHKFTAAELAEVEEAGRIVVGALASSLAPGPRPEDDFGDGWSVLVPGQLEVEQATGMVTFSIRRRALTEEWPHEPTNRSEAHRTAGSYREARVRLLHEMPCLECFRSGQPVHSADLVSDGRRWPMWAATALRHGFRSVYATPVRTGQRVIGTLNLFGRGAIGIADRDLLLIRALADVVPRGLKISMLSAFDVLRHLPEHEHEIVCREHRPHRRQHLADRPPPTGREP